MYIYIIIYIYIYMYKLNILNIMMEWGYHEDTMWDYNGSISWDM